jgi:hypothetical protein
VKFGVIVIVAGMYHHKNTKTSQKVKYSKSDINIISKQSLRILKDQHKGTQGLSLGT